MLLSYFNACTYFVILWKKLKQKFPRQQNILDHASNISFISALFSICTQFAILLIYHFVTSTLFIYLKQKPKLWMSGYWNITYHIFNISFISALLIIALSLLFHRLFLCYFHVLFWYTLNKNENSETGTQRIYQTTLIFSLSSYCLLFHSVCYFFIHYFVTSTFCFVIL